MNFLEPKVRGYNSCGLSISQLIGRARPQGGSDSRARITKTLHAMLLGRDVVKDAKLSDELLQLSEKVANLSDDELKPIQTALTDKIGKKEGDDTQHCSARFLRRADDRLLVAHGHLTRS